MNQLFSSTGKSTFHPLGMKTAFTSLASTVCLLGATGFLPTWAADLYPLQSIDFVSQHGTTKLLLHTGSIVPTRTVLVSSNKIVIDIDNVNAQEPIQTHFAHADNVSHVVLQPLSSSTVRVIIRGENLDAPSIAFKDLRSATQSQIRPQDIAQEVSTDEATATTSSTPAAKTSADPFSGEQLNKAGLNEAGLTPETSLAAETDPTAATSSAVEIPPTPDAPINIKDGLLSEEAGTEDAGSNSDSNLPFGGENLINGLLYGLGGLLILGAGGFIAYRLKNLKNQNGFDSIQTPQSNRHNKQQFRDLADQYQLHKTHGSQPQNALKTIGNKPASGQAPIGLRGFQTDMPYEHPADLGQDYLYGGNVPPQRPPVAPQKQAISQYNKQNINPATQQPGGQGLSKKRLTDEALRQEISRSNEIRKQTTDNLLDSNRQRTSQAASVLRKTAAASMPKKAPSGLGSNMNQSLPPNPEVLNFLRNVADLMEKDNQSANAINKTITPKKTR
jgi:hypothetical protein